MKKPYIVCHMLTSLNGKISGNFMESSFSEVAGNLYETVNEGYESQGWLCGRVTMEPFTNYHKPELKEDYVSYGREDFVAVKDAPSYLVCADSAGTLGWQQNTIKYQNRPEAHIIEILGDKASDAYVAYLREHNISYIFAGKEKVDCEIAAKKLYELFGIKTLMVSGGGLINGAFLKTGIVDEISLVVSPVIEPERGINTAFENIGEPEVRVNPNSEEFELKNVEIIEKDTLWITYKKRNSETK